jgi:hypothetical protein
MTGNGGRSMEKFVVLNFYYLPAIVISYFLGMGQTD